MLEKNKFGKILCSIHKITANNICLEENCQNIIKCAFCYEENNNHKKFVSIYNILDGNLEDEIYKEKKKEDFVLEFKKLKKKIYKQINLIEKQIIKKISDDKKLDNEIRVMKNDYKKKRVNFLKDMINKNKLKLAAQSFKKFIKIKNLKKNMINFDPENILDALKKNLENYSFEIKKILKKIENYEKKSSESIKIEFEEINSYQDKKNIKYNEKKSNFSYVVNKFYKKENNFLSKILNYENIIFLQNIFKNNLKTSITLLYQTNKYDKKFYNTFKENYNNKISYLILVKTKNQKKFGFYLSNDDPKNNEIEDCFISLTINKKFEFLTNKKLKIEFISASTGRFFVNLGDLNLFNFSYFFSYLNLTWMKKNYYIFKDICCEELVNNNENSYFKIEEIEIYSID